MTADRCSGRLRPQVQTATSKSRSAYM